MATDLLGAAEDLLARNAPAQSGVPPVQDDSPGQFGRGLRSGLSGAYSQLQGAAGGVAEAAGYDQFAQDRFASMRAAQADAEASAPRVGSYKDVHGIRDAYDYVTGLVGQSVPQSAAAVAGALFARHPIGRAIGATLATTPFEAGDVIQRQQNDPQAMQQDALTRGGQALVGGGLSAAAQSLLPAAVAGRMAAPVVGAGRVGVRQALREGLHELPGAVMLEGSTEGAGEAIKQTAHKAYDPNAPLDWDQIAENVIGGGVAGGAMHGAGVAVQAGKAAAVSPANTLVDASKAVGDAAATGARALGNRLSGAADSAAAGLEKAGEKVGISDPVEAIKGLYDKGATQARDFWQSVVNGEDTATLLGRAGKTAEQIKEALPKLDAERLQKITEAAQGLWEHKGLTEEQRAQLGQAMQNLGDKANQQFVAGLELGRQYGKRLSESAGFLYEDMKPKAQDAARKAADEVTSFARDTYAALAPKGKAGASAVMKAARKFYDDKAGPAAKGGAEAFATAVRKTYNKYAPLGQEKAKAFTDEVTALSKKHLPNLHEAAQALAGGTKKSEDFSGIRRAIVDKVLPVLREHEPNLLADDETIQKVGETLRHVVDKVAQGHDFGGGELAALHETFGEATIPVVEAAHEAVFGTPKATNEAYFGAINRLADHASSMQQLMDVMRENVRPEYKRGIGFQDLFATARRAVEYARSGRSDTTEQARYNDRRFMEAMQMAFGDKADTVMKAVEKAAKTQEKHTLDKSTSKKDEEGNDIGEEYNGPDKLSEIEGDRLHDVVYYGRNRGEGDKRDGLTLHPDHDPRGQKGQAYQAMERARKENPGKQVEWFTAKELGENHEGVKALQSVLIDEIEQRNAEDPLPAEEFNRALAEEMAKYGLVAAYGSKQDLDFTKRDLARIELRDANGETPASWYKHPSRMDVVIDGRKRVLDAQKLVRLMNERLSDDYTEADNRSTRHRDARMFMEGVAALQAMPGGTSFDIPDSTLLRKGLTWGEAKKLDFTPKTNADGRIDAMEKALADLRKMVKGAREDGVGKERIAEMIAQGQDLRAALIGLEQFEQRETQDGLGVYGAPFDAERAREIKDLRKRVAYLEDRINGSDNPEARAKGRELTLALNERLRGLEVQDAASVGGGVRDTMQEARDPFGNVHQALRGRDNPAGAIYTNSDGSARMPMKPLRQPAAKPAPAAEATPQGIKPHAIDTHFAKESYPEFATDKEAAKFLLQAYKRFGELAEEERRVMNDESHPTNDLEGEQRAAYHKLAELFAGDSNADLGSFLPSAGVGGDGTANKKIRAWLKTAAPEVAAKLPKSFASLQTASGATRWTGNSPEMQAVRQYVDKVLGPQVRTALRNLPHAGEYDPTTDTIRVSVHAINPTTVAYHEALHAFFAKLMGQGNGDVADVLRRAATSAPILNQLRRLLAHEPAALNQLGDAEEAAAYMYQFWAAGQLKVGDRTRTLFERVKEALAKAFGIITNDARAEMILDYFHSGQFKTAGLGQTNAVHRALMEKGRSEILERAHEMTQPLIRVADAISTAGAQRLRDTGVPALRQLADTMKATGRDATTDPGFIPAARAERTRVMNDLAEQLRGYTEAQMTEALDAMQSGTRAASPQAQAIQRIVQGPAPRALLPSMLAYMGAAGVNLQGTIADPSYFPRKYNAHYISRHRTQFQALLESHGIATSEAEDITRRLAATDGQELAAIPDMDRPGMSFLRERKLRDIPDAELAPYMSKNLYEILNSYVSQATRRAEWARRIGDKPENIEAILLAARQQGATAEQVETARNFVRGVDGTLGDSLNPTLRRFMGNVIVYQNLRLLPLAIFSSIIDPMGVMVRGGTVSDAWDTFKRGMKEIPSSWTGNFKPDAATHTAELLGVIDDAILADTTGQLYTQGLVGETARKINDKFFRFNLMEGFNRSMRVGATQAAIKFLERHRDGTASTHSARWLAELGLQPGFTMDLNDERVRAAINMWVDGAVLRPDAADKPIWMNDPHWMLVSHLKQFVYSFQETILKRVYHEYTHGNYAPAMALASYVPIMIASDAIKGMLQGGGEMPEWKRNWGPAEYLASGVERAGLLGKVQFPADGLGMMAGPTAQQALAVAEALEGKGDMGRAALKAMPANALYAEWFGAPSSRVENSMSVD